MEELFDNRITKFAREVIAPKLAAATDAQREACDKSMAIDFKEHFDYQTLQSQSFAMGLIPQEEATTVYAALGEVWSDENGGWKSHVDLALKVAITKYISELAGRMVAARRKKAAG